jgi:hypothetical protein
MSLPAFDADKTVGALLTGGLVSAMCVKALIVMRAKRCLTGQQTLRFDIYANRRVLSTRAQGLVVCKISGECSSALSSALKN